MRDPGARRVALAMALLGGLTMVLLLAAGASDQPRPGTDATTPWSLSLQSGMGEAILQTSPDLPGERVSVPKLRSLLLVGGLGLTTLLLASATGRALTSPAVDVPRSASRRVAFQRGPPFFRSATP